MDSQKIKVLSCVAVTAVVMVLQNILAPTGKGDDAGQCDTVGVASKWAAGVGLAMTIITESVLRLHDIVTKAREVNENLEWLAVVFPHRRAVVEMPRDDGPASMEAGVVDGQNTPQ